MRSPSRNHHHEPDHVLLVEDDVILGDGVRNSLTRAGYVVHWVQGGRDADRALASNAYGAVILDLMLPDRSGLEVLESLRERGDAVPVLVVSARDAVADRVRALDAGADDYVVKPFDTEEILARLRALERRFAGRAAARLRHGDLVVEPSAHAVTVAGQPVTVSPSEFTILEALLEHVGRVLSRAQLEDLVYGWDHGPGSNTVEVHIHNLRKKLPADLIRTVRGIGYLVERPK